MRSPSSGRSGISKRVERENSMRVLRRLDLSMVSVPSVRRWWGLSKIIWRFLNKQFLDLRKVKTETREKGETAAVFRETFNTESMDYFLFLYTFQKDFWNLVKWISLHQWVAPYLQAFWRPCASFSRAAFDILGEEGSEKRETERKWLEKALFDDGDQKRTSVLLIKGRNNGSWL